jgi:hypothetical protein
MTSPTITLATPRRMPSPSAFSQNSLAPAESISAVLSGLEGTFGQGSPNPRTAAEEADILIARGS